MRNMERDEGLKVYLSAIDNSKPLTPMKEGEVRARMIRANLRLVVQIAQEQRASSAVAILDLISAGNIGLMKAVGRFDPSKEGEFASFARWWIRQSIKRVVGMSAKKFTAFGQTPPDMESDEDLALPA